MSHHPGNIRISDFMYDLPSERIAKYPLSQRDGSKLLVWDGQNIEDSIFRDILVHLENDTLLVFNNTKVIRARVLFKKDSGATIEIFCLEPLLPSDFALSLSSGPGVEWKCLIGNLKRWKQGDLSLPFTAGGKEHLLKAERTGTEGDAFRVRFFWDDESLSFSEILEALGHVPIPPYLDREDEESDKASYQTVYATIKGSVAAPTAGLHFTPQVFDDLEKRGFDKAEVTLHVSAGTFRPVKSEKIEGHQMHSEHFIVSEDTIRKLIGRKVTAVGTTTVRTLESLYWLGVKVSEGYNPDNEIPVISQWEPYSEHRIIDTDVSFSALLDWMHNNGRDSIETRTDIIIVPGYRFRAVQSLITNFHQPGSTLLLLVAAFTGNKWKDIYSHALASGYRFLSYGDSMLLKPVSL